jgi:hypothetical protein
MLSNAKFYRKTIFNFNLVNTYIAADSIFWAAESEGMNRPRSAAHLPPYMCKRRHLVPPFNAPFASFAHIRPVGASPNGFLVDPLKVDRLPNHIFTFVQHQVEAT